MKYWCLLIRMKERKTCTLFLTHIFVTIQRQIKVKSWTGCYVRATINSTFGKLHSSICDWADWKRQMNDTIKGMAKHSTISDFFVLMRKMVRASSRLTGCLDILNVLQICLYSQWLYILILKKLSLFVLEICLFNFHIRPTTQFSSGKIVLYENLLSQQPVILISVEYAKMDQLFQQFFLQSKTGHSTVIKSSTCGNCMNSLIT